MPILAGYVVKQQTGSCLQHVYAIKRSFRNEPIIAKSWTCDRIDHIDIIYILSRASITLGTALFVKDYAFRACAKGSTFRLHVSLPLM